MWFHDRTPTYYAQGPGFPPQHHQKKKPTKNKNQYHVRVYLCCMGLYAHFLLTSLGAFLKWNKIIHQPVWASLMRSWRHFFHLKCAIVCGG